MGQIYRPGGMQMVGRPFSNDWATHFCDPHPRFFCIHSMYNLLIYVYIYMILFNDLKFSKGKKQPQHFVWYFKQTFCCRIVGVLVLVVVRRQPTCYLLPVSPCTKSKRATCRKPCRKGSRFCQPWSKPIAVGPWAATTCAGFDFAQMNLRIGAWI